MLISLINNITFLIALAAAGQIVISRFQESSPNRQAVLGLLFGGVAVLGMVNPVVYQSGVFFDGRSIVLAVSGVVGGGIAALIAGGIAAAFRLQMGGAGAMVGVMVIVLSASLGALARQWWKRRGTAPRPLHYLVLGVVVQLCQLAAFTQIPDRAGYAFIERAWWVLLVFYPLATMLLCLYFHNQEQQRIAQQKLSSAEEAVTAAERVSMERFHAYFDHAMVGLAITSLDKGWIEVNDALCKSLGYTRDELTRMTWTELTHPDDLAPDLVQFNRMVAGEIDSYAMDKRFVHKDGHLVDARLAVSHVRKPDGSIDYVVAMVEDISERKQAEEALRQSEATFRKLFADSSDAILLIDGAGVFVECNQAALDLLKMTREQFLLLPPARISPEFQPDGRRSEESAPEMIALAYSKGLHRFDWVCVNAEGGEFIVEVSLMPIVIRGQTMLHTTWRDITARKQVEAELQKHRHHLEELVASRTAELELERASLEERVQQRTRDLSQSRKSLADAQRIARVGNWGLDLVSNRLEWSDEIFRIFEIDKTRFAATYEAFLSAIHPDDREMVNAAYQESLRTRKPYGIVHRLLMPDGRIKYVNEQCETEFDPGGRPLRSIGTMQDITERKLVEEALERRSAELAALNSVSKEVNSSLDFARIARSLVDESLQTIKPSMAILFMRRGGALEVAAVVSHDQATQHDTTPAHCFGECLCGLAAATGKPLYSVDIFKDPRCTWAECKEVGVRSFAALPLRSGQEVIGVLGLASAIERDFSTQATFLETLAEHAAVGLQNAVMHDQIRQHALQLEQRVMERTAQLEAAKAQAESASRAKSTFLANMSHELRTPLNGIIGMTAMAQQNARDPKLVDQLGKVMRSSEHLLAVINDILDISKIEAERLKLESVRFKFGDLLAELGNQFRHGAEEKRLKLLFDVDADVLRLSLVGDPVRLRQILFNLTGNALKFTERGSVTVRARLLEERQDGVQLHIEVADTGIGISPEDQKRLFLAFEQADGSMTRKYGGTGLGLAISRRLVEIMGGRIGMASTPGQGSLFWFSVRLGKAVEADQLPAAAGELPPRERMLGGFSGTRILLAEDEPINQEVARYLLEDAGLVVDLAADGLQAIDLAARNSYALILMDMQMPRMNGVGATQAIRGLPGYAQTPILAMTANAFAEDRKVCIDAGERPYRQADRAGQAARNPVEVVVAAGRLSIPATRAASSGRTCPRCRQETPSPSIALASAGVATSRPARRAHAASASISAPLPGALLPSGR